MKKLMICGATGYTGRMAATYAKEAGLDVIIASRDSEPLAELAINLNVESNVFALEDSEKVCEALHGVDVLLNCAGPYHRTAKLLCRRA